MEAETSRVDVTVPEPVLVVPVLPLAESRSAVWRIVERALEISIAGLLHIMVAWRSCRWCCATYQLSPRLVEEVGRWGMMWMSMLGAALPCAATATWPSTSC